jgi:hypothetical protein
LNEQQLIKRKIENILKSSAYDVTKGINQIYTINWSYFRLLVQLWIPHGILAKKRQLIRGKGGVQK